MSGKFPVDKEKNRSVEKVQLKTWKKMSAVHWD